MNKSWPEIKEMLTNLDYSLKVQSMEAAPDHACIGPSVIELAIAEHERLIEAFEYLISRLPEQETAGFVANARFIAERIRK